MIYRIFAIALLGLTLGTMSLDAQVTKKSTKKDEPAGSIEVYKNDAGKLWCIDERSPPPIESR